MTQRPELIPNPTDEEEIWNAMEQIRQQHLTQSQSKHQRNSTLFLKEVCTETTETEIIKPYPNSKITYRPKIECLDCNDEGFTIETRYFLFLLSNSGQDSVDVNIELKTVCRICQSGEKQLLQWQKDTSCHQCCFGVSLEDNKSFCKNCTEGQRLQVGLDTLVSNRKQAVLNKLVKDAGIHNQTFENFQTQPGLKLTEEEAQELEQAKRKVMEAATNYRSIYLMGNCGTGKSHLSAAYLNEAFSQGRTGLFISIVDLLNALYKSIRSNEGEPDWTTILNRFMEADILVIDDLGQEKVTEKSNEVLFILLNQRIRKNRTTVISSNWQPVELTSLGYKKAIASRLRGLKLISWNVKDWRLK